MIVDIKFMTNYVIIKHHIKTLWNKCIVNGTWRDMDRKLGKHGAASLAVLGHQIKIKRDNYGTPTP